MKNHIKPQIKLEKTRTTGRFYRITGMKNTCVITAASLKAGGVWESVQYRVGDSIEENSVAELIGTNRYDITINSK